MANPIEDLINRIMGEQGQNDYFDAILAGAIDQARLNVADIDRSYGRGTEEAKIMYDEASRNLLRERDEGYDLNSGNFAGRGLLRSGIFATEQGKIGDAYQRGLTSAAQRRTSTLADLANQQLSGYNSVQGFLRGHQGEAISRADARRAAEAERALQAQYREQEMAMQQRAMEQQMAIARQQLALAGRGGGGGGGGGGYYSMEDLFPGMFAPPPGKSPMQWLSNFGVRPAPKNVVSVSRGKKAPLTF